MTGKGSGAVSEFNKMFMERRLMFEGCTRCGIPILHKRRTYVTPNVLQILAVEPLMDSVAASVNGGVHEPNTGITEEAKSQDFFFTEEFEESEEYDESFWGE
jgi:hypothetical protein